MSKPIVLTEKGWRKLQNKLREDQPKSVMMMREKMKAVLGFVIRIHRTYTEQRGSETSICLDFYNEPKRTMFLLKYGEYLDADRR